jgi:hypothetical protein
MSKMGNHVFELQLDAATHSYAEFVKRHGYAYSDVWVEVNGPVPEPDPEAEPLTFDSESFSTGGNATCDF